MPNREASVLALLFLSGAFLYAFPSLTIPYGLVVLLHLLAGAAFAIFLLARLRRKLADASLPVRLGWCLLATGVLLGVLLAFTGARRPYQLLFYSHIGLCLAGVLLVVCPWLEQRWGRKTAVRVGLVLAAVALCAGPTCSSIPRTTTSVNPPTSTSPSRWDDDARGG